jgi:chloramphenicol-sensitive protein RarD
MSGVSTHIKGIIFALGAFVIWGLVPLYWHLLTGISSFELLFHRVFWLIVSMVVYLLFTQRIAEFIKHLKVKENIKVLILTAAFIGFNWVVFIWGVSNGHVKEVSLGYFMNPLLNVVLGAVILREKLRPLVWGCVGLALAAVLYLIYMEQIVPWVSLGLALTFGFYGLLKKQLNVPPMIGLSAEALFIFMIMAIWVLISKDYQNYTLHHRQWPWMIYMSLSGILTLVPLLLFNLSARIIPLSTLGFIQYLAPSLQFSMAVFVLKEQMTINYFVTFAIIWLALIIFTIDGFRVRFKSAPVS